MGKVIIIFLVDGIWEVFNKFIQPILAVSSVSSWEDLCLNKAEIGVFAEGVLAESGIDGRRGYLEVEPLRHLNDLNSFYLFV